MDVRPSLILLLGALALCPVAALLIGDDPAEPVARARALIDAERALGIYVEPAIHARALRHEALMTAASVFYVVAHVAVAGWALIWTWYLRPDRFILVRDAFLWTQVLLVALYVAIPTAPPRLVPGAGFTDTLSGLWGKEMADSAHLLQSPFAAVPSGHVAFALVAGITFARLGDMAWLRVFGWLYPPLVVAVTVVTANHLLLDAAAAVLVVALAGALARRRVRSAAMTPEEAVHLRRARDLVDRSYDQPLDVAALAARAHVSPAHFSRRFKEAFGETPYQYVVSRRVERAQALLRETDLSVTEICLEVGFQSLGSFSSAFHRVAGVTPTAYRATAAGHPPAIPGCWAALWTRPQTAGMEKRTGTARD